MVTVGDRSWRNRILALGLFAVQPLWTLAAIAVAANFSAVRRLISALGKEL